MTTAEKIAHNLLKIKAVTLSVNPPYTWSSGHRAPIYCDNRLVISYPEERNEVVAAFKQTIIDNNIEFDVLGGTESAAIPWAAFLAHELGKPMVYIRKKSKGYGKDKLVEGTMKQGARVLIVEDLVSTGGSSIRAAQACIDEYGASIMGILVIFNYEMQLAKQAFADAKFRLYSLSDFSTLINVAEQEKYLTSEEKNWAFEWSKDPEVWSNAIINKTSQII